MTRGATTKSYSYAKSHRILEIVCICIGTALLAVNAWSVVRSDLGISAVAAVALVLAGITLADVISGVVHWAADTYGDENVPVFGAFVRTFRAHHSDPDDITRHDFIETNGDVFIFSLPVHIALTLVVRSPFALSIIFGVFLGSYLNSQVHKWAHQKEPPRFIQRLQRARILLSSPHHTCHHTGTHESHYCITTGWANALLDRTGFFRKIEALLRRAGIQSQR